MRSTVVGCALLLALTACFEDSAGQVARAPIASAPDAGAPPTGGSLAVIPSNPLGIPGAAPDTEAQTPDWCKEPLTVERLCSRADAPCPGSPAEVRVQACMNKFIWGSARPNDCGGTSVITRIGNSGRTWDFDGAGTLVALISYDDTWFGPCRSNYYVYGQPCAIGDAQEDLCAGISALDAGADDAG